MTQIREIENELIADVFAATDSDCTNGLSVEAGAPEGGGAEGSQTLQGTGR